MPIPDDPSVGVLVPTYNCAEFLPACLDSVLGQSHPPSQVVVCDDASSDGTREIIRSHKRQYPERVTGVLHNRNRGIPANFNSGLQRMKTDLVSLISGDDLWYPEKIEEEVKRIKNVDDAQWVYSASRRINERGEDIGEFKREYDGKEGKILYEMLTHKMALRNWMAERSLIDQVGYFDETLEIFEDWDYKIRLASVAPIAHVNQETVCYRSVEGSASSSPPHVFVVNLERVYKKHANLINNLPAQQQSHVQNRKRRDLASCHRDGFHKATNEGESIRKTIAHYLKAVRYGRRPHLRMVLRKCIYQFLRGLVVALIRVVGKRP